jgi:hypothetical protein
MPGAHIAVVIWHGLYKVNFKKEEGKDKNSRGSLMGA